MDLAHARDLKERVRRSSQRRFAVGLGVGRAAGDFRVSIFVECAAEVGVASKVAASLGGEIDIEVVGSPRAATSLESSSLPSPTLKIGASVGHQTGGVGSLGFFAKRRSDGARGFVSCNHVIAMADQANDGDAVLSPSRIDGGASVVGTLDGSYPRLAERAPADCAFAVLDDRVAYDASSIEGGSMTTEHPFIHERLEVTKVGRVTGARPGIVAGIEVDDVWIRYGRIHTRFDSVILISSANGERFCSPGDSGALVYTTRTFQPAGLLFATSWMGGPHDSGWTWVHPLPHVEEALGVDLVIA